MSHKITFREHGEGPLLILLHGFGGSVHHWEGCVPELAKHYRVVVPNLSHLFMSTDRIFFSIQVEVLAQFIRTHFPGEKVSLAGLSFGGALAWGVALKQPKLVHRLILINPMVPEPIHSFRLPELRYFFVMPMSSRSIYMLLSTPIGKAFLRKAATIFRDERSGGIGRLDTLTGRKLLFVSHLIYNLAWLLRKEDWASWKNMLSEGAKSKIFMIYDCEDLLFDQDVYRDFAQKLNCEKVIELTGAGHLAVKSRPETIAKLIHDYMSEPSKKAAS